MLHRGGWGAATTTAPMYRREYAMSCTCLWFALGVALALSCLGAAASTAGPAKQPGMEELLDSPDVRSGDPARRAAAWLAVSSRATREDLPALEQAALEHRTSHARRLAAEVIGEIGAESSVVALCTTLERDRSDQVRRAAAYALGVLGSKDAAPALRRAMTSDKAANNRKRAAASLSRILGSKAKPDLQNALETEDDATVRTALEWLIDRPPRRTLLPRPTAGAAVSGVCKGTRYRLYTPKQYDRTKDWPVLVSVHGTDGRPEKYLDMCRRDADKHGVVVIAPWFDFPTYDHYGTWSMRHLGMPRADLMLLDIITDVGKKLRIQADRVMLYGHSQGGQFVHRFVLAHPQRVARAAAAAPGGIVLPDPKKGFPNGTAANPRLPDLAPLDYAALVQMEMAVIVGAEDDQAHLDMAKRLATAAEGYAKRHGLPCRVQHMVVPKHGHGGRNNYRRAGSRFLFK